MLALGELTASVTGLAATTPVPVELVVDVLLVVELLLDEDDEEAGGAAAATTTVPVGVMEEVVL